MKNKIIGVWRNEEVEYTFHPDNKFNVIWRNSDRSSNGIYGIKGGNITIKYGLNNNQTWEGEIQSISNSKLSILDLTNGLNEADNLRKVYPLSPIEKKFPKYIFENLTLVFLLILCYEWISNLESQVDNIFNIYPGTFLYYLLIGIIGLIIVLIFILSCNSTIIIFNYGFEESIKRINKTSLKSFLLDSPSNFLRIIIDKFDNEYKNKFFVPFWVFSGILFFIINGSPFINNYMGVYASFEQPYSGTHGSPDGTESIDIPGYVFNKNDNKLIDQKIKETFRDIIDTEDDGYEYYESDQFEGLEYYVSSRGYLFEQTAIIEGYKSYSNRYRGFFDYVSALVYFSIEKLIVVIIWILLPFLIYVGIASYRNKLD